MNASNFVGMKRPRSTSNAIDQNIPWIERFEPKNISDIGISKVKVNQLQNAIEKSSIFGGKTKLLILTGPTGCGKSTLTQLLCKKYNFQVIEWITPERDWSARLGHIETFRQFLAKATAYKTLDNENREIAGKVVLLDDVPDLMHDSTRLEYVSVLREFLDYRKKFLIILIASDAYSDNGKRKENLARIIAPDLIKEDERVATIEFLPLTKISMTKILTNIKNRTGISISNTYLENLMDICNGDIRLAINNLQFESNVNPNSSNSGKRAKLSSSQSSTKSNPVSFVDHNSRLSLFHAVGKVLYAKRNDDGTLESKPEDIMEKLPLDNDFFNDYIQYNCIDFFDSIDDVSNALEGIAYADTLRSEFDYLDKYSSYFRTHVSISSITKNRHGNVKKTLKLTGSKFQKIKAEASARARQEYEDEYLASVRLRQKYWSDWINRDENEDEDKNTETDQQRKDQIKQDGEIDEDEFGDDSFITELSNTY